MTSGRNVRNVALIGFMGTGKTSVGRAAAETLGFTFLDTDREIETRAGMAIAEIFARQGEAAFRELEKALVAGLAGVERHVLATGGGLPTIEGNLASLKNHALVICLWATPDTIYDRVAGHSHRPLLNDPDPRGRIRTLLAAREAWYRQADVLVNTESRSVREVAQQVVHHFQSALAGHA